MGSGLTRLQGMTCLKGLLQGLGVGSQLRKGAIQGLGFRVLTPQRAYIVFRV